MVMSTCSLNLTTQLVVSMLETAQHPTDGLNPDKVEIASLKEPSPYALHFLESKG